MILEYKVTLLVLKLLNESYIFSVGFVINFSWRKVYFFIFENRIQHTCVLVSVTKIEGKYSRVNNLFAMGFKSAAFVETSYFYRKSKLLGATLLSSKQLYNLVNVKGSLPWRGGCFVWVSVDDSATIMPYFSAIQTEDFKWSIRCIAFRCGIHCSNRCAAHIMCI